MVISLWKQTRIFSPEYFSSSPGETIIHILKSLNKKAEPQEGENGCRKAVVAAFDKICHLSFSLKERENWAESGALIVQQCAAGQNRWAFLYVGQLSFLISVGWAWDVKLEWIIHKFFFYWYFSLLVVLEDGFALKVWIHSFPELINLVYFGNTPHFIIFPSPFQEYNLLALLSHWEHLCCKMNCGSASAER